jgi:long-chain acyl-CoA synthetase
MTLLYDWLKKAAKAQGNNKAVVYRDNYLSWRGLLHRVDRRAQEFKSMGIKEGAWVGLMLGNVPDFVILALALSKLDAAIVPIDPTTGGRELELILAAAPLRALVTRPRGSEGSISANGTSAPVPPSTLPRSRVARPTAPPPREATPGGAVAPGADAAEVRRRLQGTLLTCSVYKREPPDHGVEPIAVLFTADSLGDPKGVLRTDKNTVAAVDHAIASLGMTEKTKILLAVPLFHAYGWDLGFLPTLKLGSTMFLEEEISARRIGKLVREHDVDVLPGTPTMYAELSRLPTAKKLEVKTPRYLAAGSKLEQAVADEFFDKYGIRLLSCYHSTEAATVALEDSGKYPTTVGKAIDGVELKITSSDGKVAASKEGLIWVKSKTLSPKSIGPFDDEKVAGTRASGMVAIGSIDKTGWLRTGDLGRLDKTGRLQLTGREDDVVKVDGKRVALGEVEGCLEAFPKIKAAQATVVTDPMAGAMVVARVVMKTKCGAEEIIDHCARNLAPYKVPRRIEFCEAI